MRVTGTNWDAIQLPDKLRDFLLRKRTPSLRKVRLYATATCRRFWDELPMPECCELVEAVEDYTEGDVAWADVMDAKRAAQHVAAGRYATWGRSAAGQRAWELFRAAECTADTRLWYALAVYAWSISLTTRLYTGKADGAQCDLIRDVFGNPFRNVKFDKKWRTDTVTALARGMYAARDFSGMPALADALQEADCADAAILAHCRGPGPHVRGCWVVDLVLGKS